MGCDAARGDEIGVGCEDEIGDECSLCCDELKEESDVGQFVEIRCEFQCVMAKRWEMNTGNMMKRRETNMVRCKMKRWKMDVFWAVKMMTLI